MNFVLVNIQFNHFTTTDEYIFLFCFMWYSTNYNEDWGCYLLQFLYEIIGAKLLINISRKTQHKTDEIDEDKWKQLRIIVALCTKLRNVPRMNTNKQFNKQRVYQSANQRCTNSVRYAKVFSLNSTLSVAL